MGLEYITNRELENSAGELRGKIRIFKTTEDTLADIDLTCPECGYNEKRKESWGEPFVIGTGAGKKFNLQCSKCGFRIMMVKLKKEAKKKK